MRRYIDKQLASSACMHRKRWGIQKTSDNRVTTEAAREMSQVTSATSTASISSASFSSTPPDLSDMMVVPNAGTSGESQDTTYVVESFLRRGNLQHLLPLFVSQGIKNQERLDAMLCWPYVDRMNFLRDLVNEKKLDPFEFKTLEMLFRGMAYGREI